MKEKCGPDEKVICTKCRIPLEKGKVQINYLGNTFPAELLKCPSCGIVYIDENTALEKMAEVEKNLEDK